MWFGVSIFLSSVETPSSPEESIWEESVILIEAASVEEAKQLAVSIGRGRELSYRAAAGNDVSWKFERIVDVFEIEAQSLSSGVEVFSRHITESEARSLSDPLSTS